MISVSMSPKPIELIKPYYKSLQPHGKTIGPKVALTVHASCNQVKVYKTKRKNVKNGIT